MLNVNELATANKATLRAACKEAGIVATALNVEGMRAALASTLQPATEAATLAEAVATQAPLAASAPVAERLVAHLAGMAVAPTFTAEYFAKLRVPRNEFVAPLAPLAGNPSRTAKAPKPAKPAKVPQPESNGVKRPKEGTICARIWAWCDAQYNAGVRPEGKAVREALGGTLDHTTCTVQYYRWRTFNGIKGR